MMTVISRCAYDDENVTFQHKIKVTCRDIRGFKKGKGIYNLNQRTWKQIHIDANKIMIASATEICNYAF